MAGVRRADADGESTPRPRVVVAPTREVSRSGASTGTGGDASVRDRRGSAAPTPSRRVDRSRRRRWFRLRHPSLAARLVLLAFVFIAVPAVLVGPFLAAEEAKREALLRAVRTQGAVIAEGLRLALEKSQEADLPTSREALERLAQPEMRLRLLYRPQDQDSVFLIGRSAAVACRRA